jgi:hypothetical protein
LAEIRELAGPKPRPSRVRQAPAAHPPPARGERPSLFDSRRYAPTAQSIELMLKSENFNTYTTDLGEEGVDLGKLYDIRSTRISGPQAPALKG